MTTDPLTETVSTVPPEHEAECACHAGQDEYTANRSHARPCECTFPHYHPILRPDGRAACAVYVDDRYDGHLRGVPGDEDAWVCLPCRTGCGVQ